MIQKIKIFNFQSHGFTELEFCSGINTIIGSSNAGKTAILRALYWLIFNKPDGKNFVSHWSSEKERIETNVELYLDYDFFISRFRDNSLNGYKIVKGDNCKTLTAIGRDIPDEIKEILNISEVNFQKQLDSHFLLAGTSGEVARFFNKTVNLDSIDTMLTLVDSKKRKIKNELEQIEDNLKTSLIELQSLNWLDSVEILLDKVKGYQNELNELNVVLAYLDNSINEYEYNKNLYESINVESIERFLQSFDTVLLERNKLQNEINSFNNDIKRFDLLNMELKQLPEKELFVDFENYFKDIEDISRNKNKLEEMQKELVKQVIACSEYREYILTLDEEIRAVHKEMPDICPICEGTGKLKGFCI